MGTAAPAQPDGRDGQRQISRRIERFRYADPAGAAEAEAGRPVLGTLRPHSPARAAQEPGAAPRLQLEEARAEGVQQGLAEARLKFEEELRRERLAVARAIEEFAQDRFRYFRRVEKEVVELAMSIARRILHRESQLDPLMLQGAVRAVLDRVADSAGSTMRVHPSRLAAWEEWFAQHGARQRPRTLADPALAVDQCVLETSMGTTDIGVQSQLEEIESGFCDLLVARGAPGPPGAR